MSRHGDISLQCWDGEYTFRLSIKHLRQLQEVCNAGPPVIRDRLRHDQWFVDDVRETLRLGRIGAGASQDEARKNIERFVDDGSLIENVLTAFAVVTAAIVGTPDERVGKAPGVRKKATSSPKENSPSPPSTASVQ